MACGWRSVQAKPSASNHRGTRSVPLAPIGGDRVVIGFAGLVDGPLDAAGAKEAAITKARATGFLDSRESTGDAE